MKLLASGPREVLLRTAPAAMVLRVAFLEGVVTHLPPYTGGDLAPEARAKEWPGASDEQGRRVLEDQFAEIHWQPGGAIEGVTSTGHTYSIQPGEGDIWLLYGDGDGKIFWPSWLDALREAGFEIFIPITPPPEN